MTTTFTYINTNLPYGGYDSDDSDNYFVYNEPYNYNKKISFFYSYYINAGILKNAIARLYMKDTVKERALLAAKEEQERICMVLYHNTDYSGFLETS